MKERKALVFVISMAVVIALAVYFGFSVKYRSGQATTITILEFKPQNLVWEEVPNDDNRFGARDAGGVAVFNGQIWYYGGLDGNAVTEGKVVEYWQAPHYQDTWTTSDGENWQKISDTNTWPPMRSISMAKFQDKLWLQGGWSPIEGYVGGIWSSEDGINWQKVATIPWEEREGQTLEEMNGKLYMMGGVNFDERRTFNDVWESNDGINWTLVTENAPWDSRYDHDSIVYNGKMYVIGGVKLGGMGFADVWTTSGTSTGKVWEQVTDSAPWGPLHGHTVLSLKGIMWIVGGWHTEADEGSKEQWFSRDGVVWEQASNVPWIGREDHASVVFKGKLWMFAGMDSNFHWHNDIWYSTTTSKI